MDVRLPDGRILRGVPEGATRAQIEAKLGMSLGDGGQRSADGTSRVPSSAQAEPSFIAGVAQGIVEPLNNAARWLERGAERIGIAEPIRNASRALGMAGTVDEAVDEQGQQFARGGLSPTRGGRIVGNIIGTLPTAALGGVAAPSALSGALLSEGRNAQTVGRDAVIGGISGVVGDRVIRSAARAIAPRINAYARQLMDEGVSLTPGQVARGSENNLIRGLSRVEDKLTSLPVVGGMIQRGRERAQEGFERGAINRALREIGEELPEGVVGFDAVDFARSRIGDAYDHTLSNVASRIDGQFADDLRKVATDAGTMAPGQMRHLRSILQTDVVNRFTGDELGGRGFQEAYSRLGARIRRLSGRNASPDNLDLADALEGVRTALISAAERQNPAQAASLRGANRAYANFTRVRRAASNASEDGRFSVGQLRTAVRQMGDEGEVATGRALMQDYSNAASAILPSHVPNSGTADRLWQSNLLGLGIGSAAAIPYAAARVTSALMSRQNYTSPFLSELTRRVAAPTGIAAPALVIPRGD